MASGFSRLQLAAALLEYDNDPENPGAPHRSAHESAIFAHLRRNAGARVPVASRRSDYLDVSVPGEGGSIAGKRESVVDTVRSRVSRGSIDALRNPFGDDDHLEDEEEVGGDALEVDLVSWGLDAFMPKEKTSKNGKAKAKPSDLSAPHPMSSVPSHLPLTNNDTITTTPRRAWSASRSMSVGGNLEYVGTGGGILEKQGIHGVDNRRRSIGSPLDLASLEVSQMPIQRPRALSHTLIQPASFTSQSVPFPGTSVRSTSPRNEEFGVQSTSFATQVDPLPRTHERLLSNVSMGSKVPFKEEPSTSMDRTRTISNATMATILLADDNPFALRPPSRASRFDPKAAAHARTMSNASMGSRPLFDGDRISAMTGQPQHEQERRYSTTLELLRPKVLVMPSPLQSVATPTPPSHDKIRDGFQLSTDGPPLPPGARSARRSSTTMLMMEPSPPVPSNSFTPNPLNTLSLSQLTFRNTLAIGGQSDSTYINGDLPRATQDGDQAHFEALEPENQMPTPADLESPPKIGHPAGKLFGKSLIDDLESRKAQMRSKQRVFTGDQRPSMMARNVQRASTLIDPVALQTRPVSQHTNSFGSQGPHQSLGRRNSANIKPLLNFDEDNKLPQSRISPLPPASRSVFGVDTLWEREMAKLQQIEIREKAEAEEQKRREEADALKKSKKKNKRKEKFKSTEADADASLGEAKPRISAEPPTLPDIQQTVRRVPPQVPDDESESGNSNDAEPSGTQGPQPTHGNWYAGSSDEEDNGPRRTTGTGPRFPNKHHPPRPRSPGDNSEDDVPLSITANRVVQEHATHLRPNMDSDDERPLSTLLPKKQSSNFNINFDAPLHPKPQNDDDDDQPLGLRVSRALALSHGQQDDDDDKPLAYHPEQQRRTQYQMMAQQQQQQIMMQAQMQNNMFFSPPSMIGSPYFGPPMMPMMIQPPMPIPSPPPMHDQAKYGRVDKWRRDVAVEGDL